MANFCSSCGGPLGEGLPHSEVQHMSWFQKRTVETPIDNPSIAPISRVPVELPYQANEAGEFFCEYCGQRWLATWSHAECEMRMVEAEGEARRGL